MSRSTVQELAHGLIALILALFLLGVSSGLGILKGIVDLWATLLFIPEYPAVILRESYLTWRDKSSDLEKLNFEVKRLRNENAILRRELSGYKVAPDIVKNSNVRMARVSLRAPMSWWDEIRLDRGSHDGISEGMPVFHNGYLTGRITTVSQMTSWAELITSPSFMIPAVIEETRELGVIVGDGSGSVLLKYIPAGRGTIPGMKVSTAMIGEQLAPGLPIGTIAGEYENTHDGYITYRVNPGANMSRFYTVDF